MNLELDSVIRASFELDGRLKADLAICQSMEAFRWRFLSAQRRARLRGAGRGERKIHLPERYFSKLAPELQSRVNYLPRDFFSPNSPLTLSEKACLIGDGVVVSTNNDIQVSDVLPSLRQLCSLRAACPDAFFVGWDWDNHHHLHISAIYASCCDLYMPSHFANDYELSVFASNRAHLPLCAVQWSRVELFDNLDLILRKNRSNEISGRHRLYPIFQYRNQVIATLSKKLPGVTLDFDPSTYQAMTVREQISDWSRTKVHWVVPTLNDLSTRIFDVLVTGGLPILPVQFRYAEPLRDLNELDVLWYDEADIIDPVPKALNAVRQFDKEGSGGVLRRMQYALDRHHVDTRFGTLKTMIDKFFLSEIGSIA